MVDQSPDTFPPGLPDVLEAGGPVGDAAPDAPDAPDHDVRALLAITPFRRLWLALGLSSLGDWLGLLATTALAGALPDSPAAKLLAVSGVFILRLAPAVLFGPFAGVVADRLPRRPTLVYGDVVRFVLFCSIPLVGTLWWLYVATVLVEVVGLFWMPAKDATMPNLVPRRRLEAANQLSLVVTYGSAPVAAVIFAGLTLLNGILDGVLPHLAGDPTYLALYVNALTFLVSAAVIWRLEVPEGHTGAARQESIWRTALDGWRYIGRTPLVRALVLGMLGAFAAGGFVIGLAQSFVSDLGAGSPGYGTLFAAVFVGMAGGMWLGPRLLADFSRRRLFGLSIAAAGVWLVLMSLVPNIVLAVFFTTGLGACAGAAWVTGYTLLGLEVGDDVRGRTFAFVQSMVRVVLVTVLALGPIIAALFSQALSLPRTVHLNDHVSLTYTGVMATFLLSGLLAVGIGVLTYRQMDDRKGILLGTDLMAALRQRRLQDAPPRRAPYPGRFVAFEGGDGAGKSTQVALLGEWLEQQGYETVRTREPGATPTGARLREVLLDGGELTARAEALLFAADRAHHVDTVVRPGLQRGAVVVTDRYSDSSVAYQGTGRDLGVGEVAQLSRWATQGLVPDLTVVLDIAPDDGRSRRGDEHDRLEAEPDDFHARVRDRFIEIARRAPSRYLVVDAVLPAEEVQRRVRERLLPVLPESPVARAEREVREAQEQAERNEREARERAQREVEERERAEAAAAAEAALVEAQRVEEERRAELAAGQAQERAEREARQLAEQQERDRVAVEQAAVREEQTERARLDERERARRAAAEEVREATTQTTPVVERTMPLPIVRPSEPVVTRPGARPDETRDGDLRRGQDQGHPDEGHQHGQNQDGHHHEDGHDDGPVRLDDEIFGLGRD